MLPVEAARGRQCDGVVKCWTAESHSILSRTAENDRSGYPNPAHPSHRPTNILWIDDEVQADDALLRLLWLDGFQADCAESGAKGLALAATRAYDAIVLDLRLPDMFGLVILKHFNQRSFSTPVLVITGHFLETQIEQEVMSAGATAFRYKPLTDATDLGALLHSMISRSIAPAGASRGAAEIHRYPAADEVEHQEIRETLEAFVGCFGAGSHERPTTCLTTQRKTRSSITCSVPGSLILDTA